MPSFFIVFLHLSAAAVAIGSLAYGLMVLLPAVEKEATSKPDENAPAYKILTTLQPTVFVSLLILVGTGIYTLLTQYSRQGELPSSYYDILGIKMVFALTAVALSLYQTFSLRPQISDLDIRPEKRKQIPAVLKRMRTLSQLTLTAAAAALFLGVWLARIAG